MAESPYNRLFNVMQRASGTPQNDYAVLTCLKTNPMTLTDGDRLTITNEFIQWNNTIDTSQILPGDRFSASIINEGQVYSIDKVLDSSNDVLTYVNAEKELAVDIGVAIQELASAISSDIGEGFDNINDAFDYINECLKNLDERVKRLEGRS